jgi:Na+-translocating ferredoxin:NAD+ oxidoreductase RnfA subunit
MEHFEDIPHAFRGTPALFIYAALFSLAMVGLAGETLFA